MNFAHRPKRWLFPIILSASVALAAAFSGAQEAEQNEPPAAAPTTPAETDAASTNPEVFIPTEEISEDFAVSFPVDI